MARGRRAPAPKLPTASTAADRRPALREKTNITRSAAPIYEDDGNTEGLVKDTDTKKRRSRRNVRNENELVMAGGLGIEKSSDEDVASDRPALEHDRFSASNVVTKFTNRRPSRTARKQAQDEADAALLEDMKKRMQATARKAPNTRAEPRGAQSAVESTKTSGRHPAKLVLTADLPESDELASSGVASGHGLAHSKRISIAQPGSALRVAGTPAMETSILALKNFKRRPRQPSMLEMVRQRRASNVPSAANSLAVDETDMFDLEGADDVEDDFSPEAEGTPLHMRKATRHSTSQSRPEDSILSVSSESQNDESTRKRKSGEALAPSTTLEALRAKRHKSTKVVEDAELPDPPLPAFSSRSNVSARPESPAQVDISEVQVINSSPSLSPARESSQFRHTHLHLDKVVPSTEPDNDQHPELTVGDDAPADPVSSSPPPHVAPATQSMAIMADPLTQLSPPRRNVRTKATHAKPMMTATLQSLLPKRRRIVGPRHRKSDYDVASSASDINDDDDDDDVAPLDNSHLDDDEDELGGRLRRRAPTTTSKSKKMGQKPPASKKGKARQAISSATATTRKPTMGSRAVPIKANKKQSLTRTYGRDGSTVAGTSDKENHADIETVDGGNEGNSLLPDNSISMYEAAQSEELEAAKDKFAQVDDWEMEFESMSFDEHRTSSQQWR